MNDLDELFKQLPMGDIASSLGVSKSDASAAVATVLPSLISGMQANAQSPAGAASLWETLQGKDTSLVSGGISLADVDVEDGAKIVSHIFGGKDVDVAAKLGGLGGTGKVDPSMMSNLMKILAPIVLAWVAKKAVGGSSKKSDGGITDILGSVLGGAVGGGSSSGGIGDILGSVLGGGSSSGGGLGDLLGGLLGGGTR